MLNIPSGPGLPVGPSLRTATHVVTLLATDEPHPPLLQPNQVQVVPRKVGLLLTPLDGSPAPSIIEIAREVPPSSDSNELRLIAVVGDQMWIQAGGVYVYDLRTRRLRSESNPPPEQQVRSFSDVVTSGWRVSETRWIGLYLPEDVEKGKLKPGSPVMPGILPLRSVPYESIGLGLIPTRERRRLYSGEIDTTGPIPRFKQLEPMGDEEFSNGVLLTQPASKDGAWIAYEGRFPDLTLHVRRIDASGKALWTVDTRITREPQLLPGGDLLVMRGVPQVPDGKFPQPILVLLNTLTGQISSSELKW